MSCATSSGEVSRLAGGKPLHRWIKEEIDSLVSFLVEHSLADDLNPAYEDSRPIDPQLGGGVADIVQYSGYMGSALALKTRPYAELYREMVQTRSFNVRMLDGALIQMLFEVKRPNILFRSSLSFFPSPDLEAFQNEPELYLEEQLYADVVNPQVVTVPLRFDFDNRPGVATDFIHPISHLTLGQYKECRVAATTAVTPYLFIDFVLRSFYATAMKSIADELPRHGNRFLSTITNNESSLIHIGVPCGVK